MKAKKDNHRKFFYNGVEIQLKEECRRRGLPYQSIYDRIVRKGLSVEEALKSQLRGYGSFSHKGFTSTLKGLCEHYEWDYNFISNQIYQKKLSLEEAIVNYTARGPDKYKRIKNKTDSIEYNP